MSYKQTAPSPAVGWQSPGRPAVPDMWAQQRQSPMMAPSDFQQHFASQQAAFEYNCRNGVFGNPLERGMMGPPPVPLNPMANGGMLPGYPMMGALFPSQQMMGYPGTLNDTITPPRHPNDLTLGPDRSQMTHTFNNKDPMGKFQPASMLNGTPNVSSHQSLPVIQRTDLQTSHSRPNDNQRDAAPNKLINEQSESQSFISSNGAPKINHNKQWNPKSIQGILSEPITNHQENGPSVTPAAISSASETLPPLALPNDLQNVLANLLSSNNDLSTDSVSSNDDKSHLTSALLPQGAASTPHRTANTSPAALPGFNRLLPPMSAGQTTGMPNIDQQNSADDDRDKPKRRRRKRCGSCVPCTVREDCGECYVCRNKGQVNAICKSRKCLVLRKKTQGSDSGSSTGEVPSTGQFNPLSHTGFASTGMGQTGMGQTGMGQLLKQPKVSDSPTAGNADMTRTPVFGGNLPTAPAHSGVPNTSNSSNAANLPHYFNKAQQSGAEVLPGAQSSLMLYRTPANKTEFSSSQKQEQLTKHSAEANHGSHPSFKKAEMDHVRWQPPANGQVPWASQPGKHVPAQTAGHGWSKSAKQTSSVPHKSQTSLSNGQLNDLFSTFKDDMQKMNERTYGRANGVKVCKLMSKLLKLNITDEELKSSQPPKPPPNAWEQFLPDSKMQDGKLISRLDSITDAAESTRGSPVEDVQFSESMKEPAPREVVTHRLSDPEVTNSHGTTSDVEADPIGDSAQGMDTQAVDSGFSSSSPADRQSPSPKVRFGLQTADNEDTRMEGSQPMVVQMENNCSRVPNYVTTESAQTNQIFPYAQQNSGSATSIQSDQPQGKSLSADQPLPRGDEASPPPHPLPVNADEAGALDLSANSTSFPRMPDAPSQSHAVNPPQPLNPQLSMELQSQTPVTSEMKSFISSLTAQITGASADSAVQQESKVEPTQELDSANLIKHNKIAEPPNCGCLNKPYDENTEGPYYIHLGAANSIKAIRELMEERTGYTGDAIRIEKVRFTTKEGRTSLGCPAAKWILRRSGAEEKVLVVTKHRPHHYCQTAWLIIAIVVWEGVPGPAANHMYDYLTRTLPVYGFETERRCGTNQPRDCACQGWDMNRKGASFSFGCSWSVYYNGCKFARSHVPRKFKLRDQSFEGVMESKFQALGQHLGPLYKQMAPLSYGAQVRYEAKAGDCRIGFRTGRPFSGVTATVDFCAHQHRDTHNMNNGCTVVVTLTKHRELSKANDEQLHTLPMYCLEGTDEHGSALAIQQRVANGHIEILNAFSQEQRRRSRPYKKRKKGTESYQSPKVKTALMETIRDKFIQDSKDPSKLKQEITAQKHSIPLPQHRETAKQDLFNSQARHGLPSVGPQSLPNNQLNSSANHPGSMPPNYPHGGPVAISDRPTANMMNASGFAPFSNNMKNSLTLNQQMQPFYQAMIPPSADGKIAEDRATPQRIMEERVRQHILNAQLQASHNPQVQPALPQQQQQQLPPQQSEVHQKSETSAADAVTKATSTHSAADMTVPNHVTEKAQHSGDAEIDEQDEKLNPPKPRPPSPEYDDMDREEIHEDNTHLFKDPDVGGVALALSHGAVLYEVAKRELHATTALRQPDRYNPTRISLVFYQHKRLNYKNHGMQEYKKAEEERQKARRAARAAGVEYIPKGLKYKQKRMQDAALRKSRLTVSKEIPMAKFTGIRKKPGRKPGWKQKKQLRFAAYQYMWPRAVNHAKALTTTTTVTNWVKGKCMITGPYQKWISLHTPRSSISTAASTTSITSMQSNITSAQMFTTSVTNSTNTLKSTPSIQAVLPASPIANTPAIAKRSDHPISNGPTASLQCNSVTSQNMDSNLKQLLEGNIPFQQVGPRHDMPAGGLPMNFPNSFTAIRNLTPNSPFPALDNMSARLPNSPFPALDNMSARLPNFYPNDPSVVRK